MNFSPSNVVYELDRKAFYEDETLGGKCLADGNPQPSFTYQMSIGSEYSEFNRSTLLSRDVNGALVRCKAQNSLGIQFSPSIKISVLQKPTRNYVTSTQVSSATIKSTKATTASSSVAERRINPQPRSDLNSGSDVIEEKVLTEDVQQAGPRGIILSIVGVSCFLGFVIFLFFIRRCLKDRQGESYKTEELCTDGEGTSLHDPELEAHKKKEYFM